MLQNTDTWNSFGGIDLDPKEMFASIKNQNELVDSYYRKSIVIHLRSENLFWWTVKKRSHSMILKTTLEYIEKYKKIGFSEFILYYPWKEEQMPTVRKVEEEIIPDLKP